jgi:AraC-like DNA-binding protein
LAALAHYNARELAVLTGVSLRQLERFWKETFAESPQDWLNKVRIAEAKRMLLGGLDVKAVAYELGFKQTSHFCRLFKQHVGISPGRYAFSESQRNIELSPPDNQCRPRITTNH